MLCGRTGEDDPKRHFSGSVAALSLWDASLTPWQVAALYAAYQEQAVAMPAGLVLKGAWVEWGWGCRSEQASKT